MKTNSKYYGPRNLARDLIAAGFVQADYNSNNAWGFGGSAGLRFDRDNVTVKVGQASVRHQRKPIDFVTVTINGRRVWDAAPSTTAYTTARDRALAAFAPASGVSP